MAGFKRIFYKLYIFLLAIWMGGNVLTSLNLSQGWYDDPVGFIDHVASYPPPGIIDSTYNLTGFLSVITLLGLFIFIIYHGPGRRPALISLSGILLILIVTYAYFIPVHAKLFDESQTFNDQIISMSRTWIISDYLRTFFTVILFFISLAALSEFKRGHNIS